MSTTFGGLTPSSDSQYTPVYRTVEFMFGNGYNAVAPDGANGTIIEAQVNFDNLNAAQSALLETWFGNNPSWITWPGDGVFLPSNKTFRITKDGWQKTLLPGGIGQYQFNVIEIF